MKPKQKIRPDAAIKEAARRIHCGMEKDRVLSDAERAAVLRAVEDELNAHQLQRGTFAVCPLKDFKKAVGEAFSGFDRLGIVLDVGYDAFRSELEAIVYSEIARQVRIANPTPPKVARGTIAIPTIFDESELGDCLMYVLLKHCPPEFVRPEGVGYAASVIGKAINRITTSPNPVKQKSESRSGGRK